MPETFNLAAKSLFHPVVTYSPFGQQAHSTLSSFGSNDDEFDLADMMMPELKLTRQHGRYFDDIVEETA